MPEHDRRAEQECAAQPRHRRAVITPRPLPDGHDQHHQKWQHAEACQPQQPIVAGGGVVEDLPAGFFPIHAIVLARIAGGTRASQMRADGRRQPRQGRMLVVVAIHIVIDQRQAHRDMLGLVPDMAEHRPDRRHQYAGEQRKEQLRPARGVRHDRWR